MARRGRWTLATIAFLLLYSSLALDVHADESYVVRPGDTLFRIAQAHGVTVDALANANRLVNPSLIYVGQRLSIPAAGGSPPAESTDSGMSVEESGTGEASLAHTVQAGETLSRIALHYRVSLASLEQANNLANPNVIYPGQVLIVPGEATLQAAPAVSSTPAAKHIVVDKSEQRAYIYENGSLLWTFVISTGMAGSETWDGVFQVRSKIPNAYAELWGLQMPYWLGFYHTGYLENGFHALPILPSGAILWDGYLGTPVSYGCVILSYPDAETLYYWADIGTEVIVQQ